MRVKLPTTVTIAKALAPRKAKRRIKSAAITHISLCGKGKNNMAVMLKADGAFGMQTLTKAVGNELHSVVWVPEENGGHAIDHEGDVAQTLAVKQMAHDFLSNMLAAGGGIDIDHDQMVLGTDQVRIAENFIIQKGDPRFQDWKDNDGNLVDVTGGWGLIVKLLDPALIELAARGELGGVSMFGRAQVEVLKANVPFLPSTPDSDETVTDMNEETLKKLVAEAVKAALAPVPQPAATPTATVVVQFEGDISNPEDVAKHAEKVMFAKLDMSNPSDISKWQAHLAKKAAELKKAEGANPNATEIAKLQAQLQKLMGASGAPVVAPVTPSVPAEGGLTSDEATLFKAGRSLAQRFQKREKQSA